MLQKSCPPGGHFSLCENIPHCSATDLSNYRHYRSAQGKSSAGSECEHNEEEPERSKNFATSMEIIFCGRNPTMPLEKLGGSARTFCERLRDECFLWLFPTQLFKDTQHQKHYPDCFVHIGLGENIFPESLIILKE